MRHGSVRLMLGLSLLGIGFSASANTAGAQPETAPGGVPTAADLSREFRAVAKSALPAVVSVHSRLKAEEITERSLSPAEEELFRRFFGESGADELFRNRVQPPRQGQGSGFVIDAAGIILTNSHVVGGADLVLIQFADGTEYKAESWSTDPWSDLAIVRIRTETPLPVLPFGDSDQTEIGDWVLALGDPFGVGTSMTAGIISGKGRAPSINPREDFLQTDAAINPGNSGGPLVNLQGQSIGVNTAISTRSGGYDGVGFAVPSNVAKWVAQQLIEKGKVSRPYLGVAVQPLTAELRRQFQINPGEGALVAQTFPDSPAQQAGLLPGDIILDIAGRTVSSGIGLQGIVELLTIGETYPIRIRRSGEQKTLDVVLREMPDQFGSAPLARQSTPGGEDQPQSLSARSLGLDVAELTADVRQRLGLDATARGVVVSVVDPKGPAADAGIAVGDLIQRVGTKAVTSPQEFHAAFEKLTGAEGILLLVQTRQGARFVVLQPRRTGG